jgi:hypothetical protein
MCYKDGDRGINGDECLEWPRPLLRHMLVRQLSSREASGLCRKAFHLEEHARAHAITSADVERFLTQRRERLSTVDTKRLAVEAITG